MTELFWQVCRICFLKSKRRDDSVDQGMCCQAWWPSSIPGPHSRERELTSTNWLEPSTYVLWCVCVCMNVHVYVCACVAYVHVCLYACMPVWAVCMNVHVYVGVCVHAWMHAYMCVQECACVSMRACLCAYMHACVCAWAHMHICAYT